MFGADINAVNSKKETSRHIATVSKSRFRNQIIHALCLVGAAPCNPRSCNYQCNVPFLPSKYPLGKMCFIIVGCHVCFTKVFYNHWLLIKTINMEIKQAF